MSFHNVQFPTGIDLQTSGGPGFNTVILENESAVETRVARWAQSKRKWRLQYKGNYLSDIYTIIEFYMARSGSLFSFRFKDWVDFTTASDGVSAYAFDDQVIGTGDGTTTTFQLKKLYTSGATTRSRNITKPVLGEVLIGINGVNQASGWTFSDSTGIVTFSVAPTDTHPVTAGFEFDNHVRFSKENDSRLATQHVDTGLYMLPDIMIEEVKETLALDDEPSLRGARYETITADLSIEFVEAIMWTISADAGRTVILPDYTNLPLGGPYFYIGRDGGSAFAIDDHLAVTVEAATVDATVYTMILGLDSGGNKKWYSH